jgi:two-component system NarL family sensor kinase
VEEVRDRSLRWSDEDNTAANILQAKFAQLRQKSIDRDIEHQKEILRERNDFVASLAHDLKNPVLGAMKVLQLVQEGRIGRDAKELSTVLQQVIEAHEILLARIKAITLTYQHADGPAQLTLTPTSLRSIVEKAVTNTRATAKSEQKIEVHLPENEPYVNADEEALCRVFENLLVNAINHTDYNGSIKVLLDSSENHCLVKVIDSGSGISSDDIPFIFNRSWRGRTSKHFATGHGLGLHICRKIVKAHRGSIACSSELGKGSEFVVTLPQLLSN